MIVEVNVQLILAVNLLLVPISCLIHLLFGRCNWITNYFSKNSFRLTKTSVNWNYISFFCLFLFLHLFAFTKCFKLKKKKQKKKNVLCLIEYSIFLHNALLCTKMEYSRRHRKIPTDPDEKSFWCLKAKRSVVQLECR